MIALSTIAGLKADEILEQRETVKQAIKDGSVITSDAGIKALSRVAAIDERFNRELFPYLLKQLQTCKPKSVAQYSESVFTAVTEKNKTQFIKVVQKRKDILNQSQLRRVDKLLKKLGNA